MMWIPDGMPNDDEKVEVPKREISFDKKPKQDLKWLQVLKNVYIQIYGNEDEITKSKLLELAKDE